MKKKVILILGPTASGKTKKALKMAKENNGEIISVDSRQIYQEIPYFSGSAEERRIQEIEQHCLGSLSLVKNDEFNISIFKEKVIPLIDKIHQENKIPILVGGSSFYFEAILFENFLPNVEPDLKLRKELEKKTIEELLKEIKDKDFEFYQRVDKNNKVRLLRGLEIIYKLGKVPKIEKKLNQKYDFEIYFLIPEKEISKKKIKENLKKRWKGILKEGEFLKGKISDEKIKNLGLAFKFIFDFWEGKISEEEFFEKSFSEEWKYSKRQRTFLKRLKKNLG